MGPNCECFGNQQWKFENGNIISRLHNLAVQAPIHIKQDVTMMNKNSADAQKWTFGGTVMSVPSSKMVRISTSKSDNTVLSVHKQSDGYWHVITTAQDDVDPYQLWDVEQLYRGNWGRIFNTETNLVLDIYGAKKHEGAEVIAYAVNYGLDDPNSEGYGNQQWKFENGNIVSRVNNFVIQAPIHIEDGVTMMMNNSTDVQKWSILSV